MKLTVCELPDQAAEFEKAWPNLIKHVADNSSDLVLLPEVPAYYWFGYKTEFDAAIWAEAIAAHDSLLTEFHKFAPTTVLATRPINKDERRLNQAFCWTSDNGYQRVHEKYYLPEEPGFYETRWFHRGDPEFALTKINEISCGFLICSEVMFNEHARHYGRQGANLIATPRASGGHSRWQVALRMAAIASGAFVISSNRSSKGGTISGVNFGGCGYIINPDGEVLGVTSPDEPFVTVEVDLADALKAKSLYPRYIAE